MAIIPSELEKNIVIDTPQRQKNRKWLAIFIAVVILTAAVFYFGYGGSPGAEPAAMPGASPMAGPVAGGGLSLDQIDQSNKIFESIGRITLQNQIFSDKKFQSLIMSDNLPVVVGEKGRENPFAAF